MAVELEIIGRVTLLVLNLTTFIISAVLLTNCEFMELHLEGRYNEEYAMGLFQLQDDGKCKDYTDDDKDEFDGYVKAARAFGVLACLLVAFALVASTLVVLVLKDKAAIITWNTVRFGLWPCAVVATALTFLLFGNEVDLGNGYTTKDFCDEDDTDCGVGPGAVLAICNMTFLLIMVGVSFFVPVPEKPFFNCEGGTCGLNGDNAVSKSASSGGALAPPPGMIKLVVTVPKGPMGLTMGQKGPNNGHTVDVVKPDSPLKGVVQAGDELVMVNSVDLTRATEKGMMATLRAHADQERTLTLFRESPVEGAGGDETDLDV